MLGAMGFPRAVLFGIVIIYGYVYINASVSKSVAVYPDRAEAVSYNRKYLKYANINIRRYGRNSGSYLNIIFDLITTAGNNVTARIEVFEFLHNEYRRSFVEMEFKLCDLILKDQLIGTIVRGLIPCPIPPGHYKLENMSISPNIMSIVPFEKCRLDLVFFNNENQDSIGKAEIYAMLKNTDKKKQKKAKS